MTHDEREQMNRLCERIQEEKDPVSFDQLTQQLLDLLDRALGGDSYLDYQRSEIHFAAASMPVR